MSQFFCLTGCTTETQAVFFFFLTHYLLPLMRTLVLDCILAPFASLFTTLCFFATHCLRRVSLEKRIFNLGGASLIK